MLEIGLLVLLHLDLYRREGAAKAAEGLRQVVAGHQGRHPYGEPPLILLGYCLEGVACLGHGAEDATGMEQKLVALGS